MPKGSPKVTQRSQYLIEALRQMQAQRPDPRSGGELAARLGAEALTAWGANRSAKREEAKARAKQAQDMEIMERMGFSPQERFFFQQNPGEFAKAQLAMQQERAKPMSVAGGNSVYQNGQFVGQAPDYQQMGDQLIQTGGMAPPQPQGAPQMQPPTTVNAMGQMQGAPQMGGQAMPQQAFQPPPQAVFTRDPTFSEQTSRMGVEETARHNPVMEGIAKGQLGVSRGNLGVAQQRLQQDGQASGASAGLQAIEAELRRRGALR